MRRKLLWAVAATALLVATAVSAERTFFSCPAEDVTFELVTGYVYSAPADMLDSQPGTLMLTDCIDMCRKNRYAPGVVTGG